MDIKFTSTYYGKKAVVSGKDVVVRYHSAGRGRTEYGLFISGDYVKTCKSMHEVMTAIAEATA